MSTRFEIRQKHVIIIMDGAADDPQADLGNITPLQAARTPNSDAVAREGICGLAKTIPDEMQPGSDIAALPILGYDPLRYHTGRAPLEAASLDVPLDSADVAFRCESERRTGQVDSVSTAGA